jgi:hypothetical protein
MEIRNNPASNPAMPTDITRPVREGVEKHAKESEAAPNLRSIHKRAKNARLKIKEELFAEMVRKRGQNYRKKLKTDPLKSGPDRAEFSGPAQALSKSDATTGEARTERLEDLKARYQERRLETEELIARTAARLLGDRP